MKRYVIFMVGGDSFYQTDEVTAEHVRLVEKKQIYLLDTHEGMEMLPNGNWRLVQTV